MIIQSMSKPKHRVRFSLTSSQLKKKQKTLEIFDPVDLRFSDICNCTPERNNYVNLRNQSSRFFVLLFIYRLNLYLRIPKYINIVRIGNRVVSFAIALFLVSLFSIFRQLSSVFFSFFFFRLVFYTTRQIYSDCRQIHTIYYDHVCGYSTPTYNYIRYLLYLFAEKSQRIRNTTFSTLVQRIRTYTIHNYVPKNNKRSKQLIDVINKSSILIMPLNVEPV